MMRTRIFALALAACSLAVIRANTRSQDSKAITTLLSDAKTEAAALNSDAQELNSFALGTTGWQTHADKLNDMKQHTNKALRIVQDLNNMKTSGSEWQTTSIDRITPALNELARNVEATIRQFNKNPDRIHMGPYKDYAAANADLAASLSETVADFTKYAQVKAKFENLSRKLELPTGQ